MGAVRNRTYRPENRTNPVNLVSTYLAYWHGTEIAYILIIANNKIYNFTRKVCNLARL